MSFRHGQCTGTTSKGKPCSVGSMDSHNKLCGPHLTQALKKAKDAFLAKGLSQHAQLIEDMQEGEIEPDVPLLRQLYKEMNSNG